MITHIIGEPDTDDDNNPIFVRRMQIQSSDLPSILGYIPDSPIYYEMDGQGGQPTLYWQYFPNGMIVWSFNTCAHVLYGPILDYYATLGQFKGSLGSPRTDITTLPDQAIYAVFENGVLYMAPGDQVVQLTPLSNGLVISEAKVDPSIDGITKLAQDTMNSVAASSIKSDPNLSQNVSGIIATLWFNSMAPGGCMNPGFNSPGVDLLPAHVFNAHLNILATGCASNTGPINADMTITVRLNIQSNSVSATMVTYNIYHVSTFDGLGDDKLRDALTTAFNRQYSHNLFNQNIPPGINILAALIDPFGNVSIYIEPICTSNNVMASRKFSPYAGLELHHVRQFRDELLKSPGDFQSLVQMYYLFSPLLLAAIENTEDRETLKTILSKFLEDNFNSNSNIKKFMSEMHEIPGELKKWTTRLEKSKTRKQEIKLSDKAIDFIRKNMTGDNSFEKIVKRFKQSLDDEIRTL